MGSNGTIGTFVKVYVGRHIAEFPLEKQLKPADFIVAKCGASRIRPNSSKYQHDAQASESGLRVANPNVIVEFNLTHSLARRAGI